MRLLISPSMNNPHCFICNANQDKAVINLLTQRRSTPKPTSRPRKEKTRENLMTEKVQTRIRRVYSTPTKESYTKIHFRTQQRIYLIRLVSEFKEGFAKMMKEI